MGAFTTTRRIQSTCSTGTAASRPGWEPRSSRRSSPARSTTRFSAPCSTATDPPADPVNWADESYRKMTTRHRLGDGGPHLRGSAGVPGLSAGHGPRPRADISRAGTCATRRSSPPPVGFYLRGEEYSAQIEHFVERSSGRTRRRARTGSTARPTTDPVIAMMLADAGERPVHEPRRAGGGAGASQAHRGDSAFCRPKVRTAAPLAPARNPGGALMDRLVLWRQPVLRREPRVRGEGAGRRRCAPTFERTRSSRSSTRRTTRESGPSCAPRTTGSGRSATTSARTRTGTAESRSVPCCRTRTSTRTR